MADTTVGNIAIGFVAATGGFSGGADKIIKALGKIHLAAQAVTKSFATVSESLDRMDALVDTADNLGIATDALISLRFAAEQTGGSAGGMDAALAGMNKNVGLAAMGMGRAGAAIQELGLDVQKIKNMAPDEMFSTLAESLSKVQDESTRAALAARIFGGDASQLLTLLRGGAGGVAALGQQAEVMGLHLGEGARKAAEAKDALAAAGMAMDAMIDRLVVEMVPSLLKATEALKTAMPVILEIVGGAAYIIGRASEGITEFAGLMSDLSAGPANMMPKFAEDTNAAFRAMVKLKEETEELAEATGRLIRPDEATDILDKLEKELQTLRGMDLGPVASIGMLVPDKQQREADQARARQLLKDIEAAKALNAETEKQRQTYLDLARDAERVGEQMRTPFEKLNDELQRLTEMFNAGLLDFVTFSRAAAELQKDFQDSLPRGEAPRSAGFMAEGSVAAFSNANLNKTNGLENIARQQLRKQGEAVAATAQVEAAIRNGFNTINTFVF